MNMRITTSSHGFASEILDSTALRSVRNEALGTLGSVPAIVYGQEPWSERPRRRATEHPIDAVGMRAWLRSSFQRQGWDVHPIPQARLAADYVKDRVQVEVEFGDINKWTYDLFKIQVYHSSRAIDAAVLAVPMARFGGYLGRNVANFERVVRELPHAKLSITLPILVIGLEPEDYSALPPRTRGASRRQPA